METGQWLKTIGLFVMVLVSLYILLPSAIEIVEGPEALDAPITQQERKSPTMDVRFDVADAEAGAATAKALSDRLKGAGVPVRATELDESGRVHVLLAPGGTADAVHQLALAPGHVEVFALDAVIAPPAPQAPAPAPDAPAPDAPPRWTEARALFGKPVPPDVAPVAGASVKLGTGDAVEIGNAPAGDALIAVDGLVRAAAIRTEAGFALQGLAFEGDDLGAADLARALALVRSGPLPTSLTPYVPPAEIEAVTTDAVAHVSAVPPWVRAILPPYKISLGLDLQGGIDLTLAIELEEAVLGQVQRDASLMATQGTDVSKITSVQRDPIQPLVRVISGAPLNDLKKFMSDKFNAYEYTATEAVPEGTAHLFTMKESEQKAVADSATEQVLETLRKRIDATGVKEPTIVKKGVGRINIQLPGKVDLQSAIDAIGTTAVLEFRLLDETVDASSLAKMLTAASRALPPDQYGDDEILDRWLHDHGYLADDRVLVWKYVDVDGVHIRDERPETANSPAVLQEVILTGADISTAGVNWDQNQSAYVTMEFKSRGSKVFCDITGANVGKQFAIVLDDEIRSAPNIKERICGGSARIEMGNSSDDTKEANTLALVLRTGSLNAPVSIGQVNEVGATLGRDAINDGLLAMVIGSLLVFVYMGLWYRVSGMVANFTLMLNVLMVLTALAMFGATLTLPGICGIALTVGIAVDANIIVYERIREELRLGLNPRKAVDVGFEKAFSAIIDAHVTQAIAGVVLYSYGAGPIKGFAVAMIIGIGTTLFTSLVASRVLMEHLTRNSTARLSI